MKKDIHTARQSASAGRVAGRSKAVGAIVRLRSGDRHGPAREVHAGHGYWSQDSATVLLAAPSTPTGLQVRWPGGKSQEFAWPAGARSVEVSTEGIRGR